MYYGMYYGTFIGIKETWQPIPNRFQDFMNKTILQFIKQPECAVFLSVHAPKLHGITPCSARYFLIHYILIHNNLYVNNSKTRDLTARLDEAGSESRETI